MFCPCRRDGKCTHIKHFRERCENNGAKELKCESRKKAISIQEKDSNE